MKIVVVGGGSAGWMTAAYLKNKLPKHNITVVDKEHGNPVGVGEATIIDFAQYMEEAGFDREEWIPACRATVKAGILFPNWLRKGLEVWHPFFINFYDMQNDADIWDYWSANKTYPYKDYAIMMYDSAVRHNKIDPNDLSSYAYHVDCGAMVQYIQQKISSHIHLIKQDVIHVEKQGQDIQHLLLKNGQMVHADLFIDCTGFQSLLKKQDRVDLSKRLFCDTAVAGRVEYKDESEFVPYVVCDAVDHGWIWKIPTQDRMGSGLVFKRSITDPVEAVAYFCRYWDDRIKPDQTKVIDWTPYYSKNFWEGNVVSIGLSGGFIEPLESTGLSCMIKGIKHLEERIRIGYTDQNDRNYYNTRLGCYYENAIDFVNMHYSKTELSSKFWDYVKENHTPSDYQLWMEDVMRDPGFRNHVAVQTQNTNTIFHPSSWFAWMAQFEFEFNPEKHSFKTEIAESKLLDFYAEEQARKDRCVDHKEYIESFGGLKWK